MIDEAHLKRLRWRCRRGTRELDALLGAWLDAHAVTAPVRQLAAFGDLLEQQDPVLWDWLMGHAAAPHAEWQSIMDQIRGGAKLAGQGDRPHQSAGTSVPP